MGSRLGWSIMMLLAFSVSAYALAMLLVPQIRSSFVLSLFSAFPKFTWIHLFGGGIAMVAGALQLNSSIREKYLSLHRQLGRLYVAGVLFGGIAALVLAINSVGGTSVQSGFALLAVFWLGTTFAAYYCILQGRVGSHKNWMIRSYALTLAGVTLRVYLGVSAVLGIKFMDSYPLMAWLCWIPNLLVAEIFLRAAGQEHDKPGKRGTTSGASS